MTLRSTAYISKLLFLTVTVFGLIVILLLYVSRVSAQVPDPYVPCNQERPDFFRPFQQEFHSLRPYQASPCNQEVQDFALFCGNDLVVKDTRTVSRSEAISCEDIDADKEICLFNTGPVTKHIIIDLSGAELPIAGFTEGDGDNINNWKVTNSQDQDENLAHADKVNEYVSWYLNGVLGRAEYPLANPEDPEDSNKIVNLSGPLKKLLPQRRQTDLRIATIEKADETRHNQIVGCTSLFGIPVPCYGGGFFSIALSKRLQDWEGVTPPSTSYRGKTPPLEENYDSFTDYWEAYNEWRGKTCTAFTIPIINQDVFLCFNNALRPDFWATLFDYIPFSSTEDRKGEAETETVSPQQRGGVTIYDVSFTNQDPAELFFAHMEELDELSDILQDTFVPKNEERTGDTGSVSPGGACDLVRVRANPGDDLFAGEIEGDLNYTAEFTCEFDLPELEGACLRDPDCSRGFFCNANLICEEEVINTCTVDIFVNMQVVTKSPLVDNVWERLVAGPASVFKRIFPKLGADSPISSLLDIPAVTKVNYSGSDLVSVGNPGSLRDGESAELYFPHLGSVHEYFLKGIQTALRPKGYGESLLSGSPGTVPPDPDSDTEINCNKNAPDVNIPGIISKEDYEALAIRLVPQSQQGDGTNALECYNDVVAKAIAGGVNPAYALVTWLIESNASNYNISVEDFGIHKADVRGFNDQIQGFINTVTGFYSACSSQSFWTDVMEATLYLYRTGDCYKAGNTNGQTYYNTIKNFFWPAVAPGCSFPTSPTENTC